MEKKSTYNGYTEARKKANARYNSKFELVRVRFTTEEKAEIQNHTEKTGESLNGFIRRAAKETIERDKSGE